MKRVKIAHVLVLPIISGVQRISLQIMQGLPDELYDKTIICGCDACRERKDNFEKCFSAAGCRIIYLNSLHREICLDDTRFFLDMYRICRKEKFDIVHTNSTKPGISARIAARLASVPLVIHTVHGTAFFKAQPTLKRVVRYAIEIVATLFGHKLILVNRYYKRFYRIFNPITIYNGVDFKALPSPSRAKRVSSEFQILFVGRLDYPKDIGTLIRSMAIIRNKGFKVHLTVVGDGEDYAMASGMVRAMGLTNLISFKGWVNDPYSYYSNSDVLCVPSRYEAFGMVFVEAMHYGLPVVSTLVEGIPEVVLQGKTGILVPPSKPELLANALIKMIQNDNQRLAMGKAGKAWVESSFCMDKMIREYRKIYETSHGLWKKE